SLPGSGGTTVRRLPVASPARVMAPTTLAAVAEPWTTPVSFVTTTDSYRAPTLLNGNAPHVGVAKVVVQKAPSHAAVMDRLYVNGVPSALPPPPDDGSPGPLAVGASAGEGVRAGTAAVRSAAAPRLLHRPAAESRRPAYYRAGGGGCCRCASTHAR